MKILSKIAALTCALMLPAQAGAVNAYPGPVKVTLGSGQEMECHVIGDEFCHAMITPDGRMLRQNADGRYEITDQTADLQQMRAISASRAPMRIGTGTFPTTGNLKGIILLVEFSDNEFQPAHTADVFHSVMNAPGCTEFGATGSARDYFVDQSGGLFTPDFDVVGPIKMPKKMSYYGANDRNGQDSHPAEMVRTACEIASADLGVDFSDYDFNDDGLVDFVYVIYAGYAESYGASSNTIWPHASDVTYYGENCTLNGKTLGRYACSSELKFISGDTLEGIGTFCHEFSHVLGQADHYNTRYPSSVQLGVWDIMDQGNYNNDSHTPPAYSAFERQLLGWMEIEEIDTPSERMELPELTQNRKAYRISTPNENEYFTLENRQQVGWDAYLPAKGLMIMHITYDQSAWNGNYVNSGTVARYDLVEADGTQGSETATDLYPIEGNDAFTDYTKPSSLTVDGKPTAKGVSGIRDEDGLITFRFMLDKLSAPEAYDPTEIGSSSFRASWSAVENAKEYQIDIQEILPEPLNPILATEDFDTMTEGGYPNADMTDISESINDYLNTTGWSGEALHQAGGSVMLGAYATAGRLQSPVLAAPESGQITVGATLKSYPGKSVNYTVSLVDAGNGTVLASYKGKATKNATELAWHAEGVTGDFALVIETTNERLFIDRLCVLKGNVEDEQVWSCGPKSWSIEHIDGTSCIVENLEPGRTYRYTVTASATDVMHASDPSRAIEVTTGASGIVNPDTDSTIVETRYFDSLGRPVTADYHGLVITLERLADGTVRSYKKIL